ncbi:MAG: DUF389 domain-containing protein [Novosphingobium sp.]|nr:DUF389 domain-containing protein [Novosphingobium sp.]
MTSGQDFERQKPPGPVDDGARLDAADGPEADAADQEDKEPPVPLTRFKTWLKDWRIRIAHAVLLPELSPKEARELRRDVYRDSNLTSGYILMCALSAGIATLGLLQSSTAVVIGAMLISPLMGPIAALGFGFASIDGHRIRDAARVVIVGALIGILTGVIITWISPIKNATPEILARTQPTLLDLAVALFSGIAGGYATVIRKGGTAIGVAIATALMPPLATLGYGIGVLQAGFAFGAFLLFLTNLAAIAFAFALIARLSGAARPLYKVEWTPRYVVVLVAAFLALATPLSMTLIRISHEATMRSAAQAAILDVTGGKRARIAQLDAKWPLFGDPTVEALVISPVYAANAAQEVELRLRTILDEKVDVTLQQVQAADLQAQTRAMVDAAMERTVAGISADVPPFSHIRGTIGLPTQSMWTDRGQRMVYVEPVPAPDWTLEDYRMAESHANTAHESWTVRVVPPPMARLKVRLPQPKPQEGESAGATSAAPAEDKDAIAASLAIWALQRWGMSRVILTLPAGEASQPLRKALDDAGILFLPPDDEGQPDVDKVEDRDPRYALIDVYAPSPTRVAAAAKAKAEAEAKAKAEAEAEAKAKEAAAKDKTSSAAAKQ